MLILLLLNNNTFELIKRTLQLIKHTLDLTKHTLKLTKQNILEIVMKNISNTFNNKLRKAKITTKIYYTKRVNI